MASGTWLVTSLALHSALFAAVLWGGSAPVQATQLPADVWHSDIPSELGQSGWVPVEVAIAPPPQPVAPPPQPAAAEPQPAAAEPTPALAPPAVSPPPKLHAPAKPVAPLKKPNPPPPPPPPPEEDEEDWLGESGDVMAAPAVEPQPAPAAQPDELVSRLLAAERRKAAQREAAEANAEPPEQAASAAAAGARALPAVTSALPAGVRDLAVAVTRAIPYASNADPVWARLPLGLVGRLELRLVLEDGVLKHDTANSAPRSAPLARLEHTTLNLLKAGRFALSAEPGESRRKQEGVQRLQITVRLSQEPKRDALKLGFDAPSRQKPGNAYFVLPSGRRFDAQVKLLN